MVCSTNHAELLDRAAWRRFQLRLELGAPSRSEATRFLEALTVRFGGSLGLAPRTLADRLHGASYAELEQFALDVRRRYVLALPDARLPEIARTRLEQWRTQARRDLNPRWAGAWAAGKRLSCERRACQGRAPETRVLLRTTSSLEESVRH